MPLNQDDIRLITDALAPKFKEIQAQIATLRIEMHDAFRKQGESLTRAITDAVKMMTDN